MQNIVKLTLENGEVVEVRTRLSKSETKSLVSSIVEDTFADDFINPNYTDFDYSLINRFVQAICVDDGLPEGEEEIYEWAVKVNFESEYRDKVEGYLFIDVISRAQKQVEHRIRKNLATASQDNTANDTLMAIAGVAYKVTEFLELAKERVSKFSDVLGEEELQGLVKDILMGSVTGSDESEEDDFVDDVDS